MKKSSDDKNEHELKEKVVNMAEEALNKVDEAVKVVQESACEYTEELKKYCANATEYIKENPLMSVGLAFGGGVLLAIAMGIARKK